MIKTITKFVLGLFLISSAIAADPPPNFFHHKDTLNSVIVDVWPDFKMPSVFAGQIEKESCITLKHSKCWSRYSELKTSREYGFGLGQLTVTSRFNAFEEVKALDARLHGWKWDDRYNARNQMIAIVAMMKRNYRIFKSPNEVDRVAFALASYNGGIGGIQSDQRICRNTKGCDPNLWFGNTELHSLKAKTALKGYGQSFFQINRQYPRQIIFERRQKYIPYVGEDRV